MNRFRASADSDGRKEDETAGDQTADGQEGRSVVAIKIAKEEALNILNDDQYWQVVGLVKRLIDFGDKEATADLAIAPIGEFWELKLKGGFLKKLNIRIYFAYVKSKNQIVVLKTYKKEEDRRVSPHIILSLEDRLEDYLAGKAHGASTFRGKGERY